MRLLVLAVVLLAGVLAEKETLDDETFALLTEDLLKEIKKRISQEPLGEDPLKQCESQYGMTTERDTIIMTRDSMDNGATYIASPSVTYGSECIEACCQHTDCNTAVFKEKFEPACYLFDCGKPGSTCQFANHTGFSVMKFPLKNTAKVLGKHHEDALENLATTTKSPPPTTTTEAITTTTAAASNDDDNIPVPLFGACNKDKDCAGSSTMCKLNYCVCQNDYHAQDGECKPDKTSNGNSDDDGGDMNKQDSDETQGWDDNDSEYKHMNEPDSDTQAATDNKSEQKTDEKLGDNDSEEKHRNEQQNNDGDQNKSQDSDEKWDDNDSEEKHKNEQKNDEDQNKSEGWDDNDSAEKLQNQQDGDPENTETNESGNNMDVDNSDDKVNNVDTHVAVNPLPNMGAMEVDKEESEGEESVSQSNQGAVIALALGLSITALLLVFVGCRLRSVKRRLRRGRPLNSNEADYLVNGMYL